jgi:hypothetical protein
MELGARHIRTAGKGSGSIELTLPAALRDLVGLRCRIVLRDGSRPDIVLQPDLQAAQTAFETAWLGMASCLHATRSCGGATLGPPRAMPHSGFLYGLHPRATTGCGAPFLAWGDGIRLSAGDLADAACLSRVIAGFGQAMAPDLEIGDDLAAGFGAACSFLVTGVTPAPEWQEPCDVAAASLPDLGTPGQALRRLREAKSGSAQTPSLWAHAAPVLAAACGLFQFWTVNPGAHAALRAAWRRGRMIEMSPEEHAAGHRRMGHATPAECGEF